MNRFFLRLTFFCTLLGLSSRAHTQVTIGTIKEPNKGAILDLKEIDPVAAGGANTTKGLALPRVELTLNRQRLKN